MWYRLAWFGPEFHESFAEPVGSFPCSFVTWAFELCKYCSTEVNSHISSLKHHGWKFDSGVCLSKKRMTSPFSRIHLCSRSMSVEGYGRWWTSCRWPSIFNLSHWKKTCLLFSLAATIKSIRIHLFRTLSSGRSSDRINLFPLGFSWHARFFVNQPW